MPLVANGSHNIHYTTIGQGTPIVFIHGIFTSGQDWEYYGYTDALQDFMMILVDLRGHGKSSDHSNPEEYDPEIQASDIKCVLEDLKLDRAIIWGYSFGGRIAYAFALLYPQCVLQLVVGGMHPYPVTRVYPSIHKRMDIIAKGMDKWVQYLEAKNVPITTKIKKILLENNPNALVANDHSILSWQGFGEKLNQLHQVSFEIILYVGEKDHSYNEEMTSFARDFGIKQMLIVRGLGHGEVYVSGKIVCRLIGPKLIHNQK